MNKYYVDTSIWRDLHENRSDGVLPLGEFALKFFQKVRSDGGKVLYSNIVIDELSRAYTAEEIKNLFLEVADLLEYVPNTIIQSVEAFQFSKKYNMSFGDALHTILARDSSVILVTRDHHFKRVKHIVTVKLPEEL